MTVIEPIPWKNITIALAILVILCIAAFTTQLIFITGSNTAILINQSYMDGFTEGWNMHGNALAEAAYERGIVEVKIYEGEPVRSLLSPAGCVAAIEREGCVIECPQ